MKIVRVTWRDAWFDVDGDRRDWRAEYPVTTVGFLVRDTPEVLSVAAEQLPGDDGFRAITHIPQVTVLAFDVLWSSP